MKSTHLGPICVFLIVIIAHAAGAEVPGDIDNNGKTGLSEAVYALQAAAGMHPTTGNARLNGPYWLDFGEDQVGVVFDGTGLVPIVPGFMTLMSGRYGIAENGDFWAQMGAAPGFGEFPNVLEIRGTLNADGTVSSTSGTYGSESFSGFLMVPSDASALTGYWSGTVTDTTVVPSETVAIHLTFDRNGRVVASSGFVGGLITGYGVSRDNAVIVHLQTYRLKPYRQIVLRGLSSAGEIVGTVEIDNGGDNDPDGSFVIKPYPAIGDALYWDLHIPAVGNDAIDAYYLISNGDQITGSDILAGPIAGTLSGDDLSFSHNDGGTFTGLQRGNVIEGSFTKDGQTYPGSLRAAVFHFTNFHPGMVFPSSVPSFHWTADPGATSYTIRIMRDTPDRDCHESGPCTGIWEKSGITATRATFNEDGGATETLQDGWPYRARVISSTGRTTMDVSFSTSSGN